MTLYKRLMTIILVSLACAGCDQGTKTLATEFLPKDYMTSYFYDTVRIGYTENTGAFLGLGSQWPEEIRFLVFTVLSSAILIGLLIYLISATNSLMSSVGLSLIFGGGTSNLYDRIFNNGAVVDFLNIGFGGIRTGIFNIADVALMLGTALVLYSPYWGKDSSEAFH